MTQYTVIMVVPDYLAESYGTDIIDIHVSEPDLDAAIVQAQRLAAVGRNQPVDRADDFYVTFVCEGHVENLAAPVEEETKPLLITEEEHRRLQYTLIQLKTDTVNDATARFADGLLAKLRTWA